MRWVLGIILPVVGFLLVWKTGKFYEWFGPLPFAEKYIHSEGGSRLMYKLIGTLLIFVGFLFLTNLHVGFVEWIAKTFFGAF